MNPRSFGVRRSGRVLRIMGVPSAQRRLSPDLSSSTCRVVFVEYRKVDLAARIKEVHKMSVEQLEREMNAVGLVRVRTVERLTLQHIAIVEKRN
jgi:hypothetical protein